MSRRKHVLIGIYEDSCLFLHHLSFYAYKASYLPWWEKYPDGHNFMSFKDLKQKVYYFTCICIFQVRRSHFRTWVSKTKKTSIEFLTSCIMQWGICIDLFRIYSTKSLYLELNVMKSNIKIFRVYLIWYRG